MRATLAGPKTCESAELAASPNLASHEGREGPGGTSNLTRGVEFLFALDASDVSDNVADVTDLRPPS